MYPGELATQKFKIDTTAIASGFTTGGSFAVDVPQWGLLRRAFLCFQLKNTRINAATNDATNNFTPSLYGGVLAFQRIVLQTASGNVISTLYPDIIMHKMHQRPDASKLMVAAGAATAVAATAGGGALCSFFYCPLLFDIFDHPSTWLDCLTLEPLQLVFYSKSVGQWGAVGTNANVTLNSSKLVLYYAMPTPERHNLMLEAKHPSGQSFNSISFNNFAEAVVSIAAGVTVASIQMYCSSPIYRTIIAIRNQADVTGGVLQRLNALTDLNSVKVSDSGNVLYESNHLECALENGMVSYTAESASGMAYVVINWGLVNELDPDQRRSITAVSLYQMSNPIVELNFADNAIARRIEILHQTLQAVSVSASPNNRNRQITVLSDR